jgi:hypothetical protein
MGFKTGGQQAIACNSKAKSAVNGRCGTSGNKGCTTVTLTGTDPSSGPVKTLINVYHTINSMTTTTINYTITSITYNDGTSVTYPYTFPTGSPDSVCSSVVTLCAANTSNPPSGIYATPSFNLPTTTTNQGTTITSDKINTPITSTFFYAPNAPTMSVLSSGASYAYVAWWLNTKDCINPLLNNNSNPNNSGTFFFTI